MEGKKVKHYIQQLLIINNSIQKHESTKHNMTMLPCSISNLIIEFPWEYWLLAAQDSISWRELFLLFWHILLRIVPPLITPDTQVGLLQCYQMPPLSQTGVTSAVAMLSNTSFESNKCCNSSCNSSCKMLSNTCFESNRCCFNTIRYPLWAKQMLQQQLQNAIKYLPQVKQVLLQSYQIPSSIQTGASVPPLSRWISPVRR